MRKIGLELAMIIMVGFLILPSCSNAQKEEGTIAKDVDVTEFKKLIENSEGLLLDVRTAGEINQGYIENDTKIDFRSSSFESEIEKLDKDKPVYVYCASGGRSGKTMAMMNKNGFKEVYNLKGGFGAWQGAGNKVAK